MAIFNRFNHFSELFIVICEYCIVFSKKFVHNFLRPKVAFFNQNRPYSELTYFIQNFFTTAYCTKVAFFNQNTVIITFFSIKSCKNGDVYSYEYCINGHF